MHRGFDDGNQEHAIPIVVSCSPSARSGTLAYREMKRPEGPVHAWQGHKRRQTWLRKDRHRMSLSSSTPWSSRRSMALSCRHTSYSLLLLLIQECQKILPCEMRHPWIRSVRKLGVSSARVHVTKMSPHASSLVQSARRAPPFLGQGGRFYENLRRTSDSMNEALVRLWLLPLVKGWLCTMRHSEIRPGRVLGHALRHTRQSIGRRIQRVLTRGICCTLLAVRDLYLVLALASTGLAPGGKQLS